ncbi:MAG: Rho GTPase-activating protein [Parachlamydiaceae bacterium]
MRKKISRTSLSPPIYRKEERKAPPTLPPEIKTALLTDQSDKKRSSLQLKGRIARTGQSLLRFGKRVWNLFAQCIPCIKALSRTSSNKTSPIAPMSYQQQITIPEETAITAASRLIDQFNENDVRTHGIFRETSSIANQKQYLEKIKNEENIDFSKLETLMKCDLLKSLFRNIPIFDKNHINTLETDWQSLEDNDKIERLRSIIAQLPEEKREVFKKCLKLLMKMAEKHEENKMPASNLALIFSPVFFQTSAFDAHKLKLNGEVLTLLFQKEHVEALFPESSS